MQKAMQYYGFRYWQRRGCWVTWSFEKVCNESRDAYFFFDFYKQIYS